MRFERGRAGVGVLQVQPELMAADSVRMEIDGGGGDDTAMPLLDNFDSLESKVGVPRTLHWFTALGCKAASGGRVSVLRLMVLLSCKEFCLVRSLFPSSGYKQFAFGCIWHRWTVSPVLVECRSAWHGMACHLGRDSA